MDKVLNVMKNNIILDLRNLFQEEYVNKEGFRYKLLRK